MQFLKKEWRTLLLIVWLAVISLIVIRISLQLGQMQTRQAGIASTLGTVESIVIGTDAGVMQVHNKVGTIDANVDFIVERIRRR